MVLHVISLIGHIVTRNIYRVYNTTSYEFEATFKISLGLRKCFPYYIIIVIIQEQQRNRKASLGSIFL